MTERIGFVGAGLMGHGMARNILAKGYPLTTMAHRNRVPIDDLVARGAAEVANPAEVARASDIVFTCVNDSTVVETVVFGENGLVAGARPGLVLVDSTTADPQRTRDVGARLAEHGVRMLDAPVTLTPKEALEGTLNVIVGGDPDLVERVRPVLATFSRAIFPSGALGTAHTLKLINNFLSLGNMALAFEAITTAACAGVDRDTMLELIPVSGGASESFRRIAAVLQDPDATGGRFAIRNGFKDVNYYVTLAERCSDHAPLGESIRQFYRLALALGEGDSRMVKLLDIQGRLAGGDRDR